MHGLSPAQAAEGPFPYMAIRREYEGATITPYCCRFPSAERDLKLREMNGHTLFYLTSIYLL
jgi:hypothetical protein